MAKRRRQNSSIDVQDDIELDILISNININQDNLLLDLLKKINILDKKLCEFDKLNIKIDNLQKNIDNILLEKDYIISNLNNEIYSLKNEIKDNELYNSSNKKINDYFC